MGVNSEISDAEMEIVQTRIIKQFSAKRVVEEVFATDESQKNFIDALLELSQHGVEIKVGGRSLRLLMGCKVVDFAKDIARDADRLSFTDPLRLGPLVDILKRYPTQRMLQNDLDFFIDGASEELVEKIFKDKGFSVSIHQASGGIWVVEIKGENGVSTFVDSKLSWQTGDLWPMFAFKATFNSKNKEFEVNISKARLDLYPLEIPLILGIKDPLDPKRVAAIARALLWAVTAKNSSGQFLNPPYFSTRQFICETVYYFPRLLNLIKDNPELEVNYRSALRDMAIALRLIVLSDWTGVNESYAFNTNMIKFFENVSANWTGGLLHFNKQTEQ